MASCVDERNNFIWTLLLHTKPMEAENQIKRKMNAKSGDTVGKASVAAKPRHRCTCSWFAFQARRDASNGRDFKLVMKQTQTRGVLP